MGYWVVHMISLEMGFPRQELMILWLDLIFFLPLPQAYRTEKGPQTTGQPSR